MKTFKSLAEGKTFLEGRKTGFALGRGWISKIKNHPEGANTHPQPSNASRYGGVPTSAPRQQGAKPTIDRPARQGGNFQRWCSAGPAVNGVASPLRSRLRQALLPSAGPCKPRCKPTDTWIWIFAPRLAAGQLFRGVNMCQPICTVTPAGWHIVDDHLWFQTYNRVRSGIGGLTNHVR